MGTCEPQGVRAPDRCAALEAEEQRVISAEAAQLRQEEPPKSTEGGADCGRHRAGTARRQDRLCVAVERRRSGHYGISYVVLRRCQAVEQNGEQTRVRSPLPPPSESR
jgi:hypothetical protein